MNKAADSGTGHPSPAQKATSAYSAQDFDDMATALGVDVKSVVAHAPRIESVAYWFYSDRRSPRRVPPSQLGVQLDAIKRAALKLLGHLGVKQVRDAPDGPPDRDLIAYLASANNEVTDGEEAVTVATGRIPSYHRCAARPHAARDDGAIRPSVGRPLACRNRTSGSIACRQAFSGSSCVSQKLMGRTEIHDKLPSDVRASLEGSNHRPVAILGTIPRAVRHRALRIIFKKMGLIEKTHLADPQGCREAIRNIGDLVFDYRRLRYIIKRQFTPVQRRKRHAGVYAASTRLLNLLSDEAAISNRLHQSVRVSPNFFGDLRRISAQSRALKSATTIFDTKTTKNPDLAVKRLINNLAYWFKKQTGKDAKLARRRNYSLISSEDGKPSGAFFEIVSAMFDLLGEKRGPEAIATAIRRRNDMGKFQAT